MPVLCIVLFYKEKVLYTMSTFFDFDLVTQNSLIKVNILDLNTFVTYDLH